MYRSTGLQVYRCTGVQVYRCTGVLVYRCTVHYRPVSTCMAVWTWLNSWLERKSKAQVTVLREVSVPAPNRSAWRRARGMELGNTSIELHR